MTPHIDLQTKAFAEFRFYEELNDFLAPELRKRAFQVPIDRGRSVKDAIESVGVPHTEVDLVLVDGASVAFEHVLRGGERVAVYPVFERLDIAPVVHLRPSPLRETRFVLDRSEEHTSDSSHQIISYAVFCLKKKKTKKNKNTETPNI